MEKKEKIKHLQIKNHRRILCEKMKQHIEEIEIDDFISIDRTIQLQNEILQYLDEMDKRESSLKESISNFYVDVFKRHCDIFSDKYNQKVVFFHSQAVEIGAVNISVESVMKNMDYILSISEMHEQGCSVFVVSSDMKFGLCLWKDEYDFTIYKWSEKK